jgi:DNA primase
VVGFGGRVLDGSQPKYLNTSETQVFNKRHILYGLDKANQPIRQSGQAIVVEGYMDLIALHTSGINNAVASLGTAFTPEQAKRLVHYRANEVYFAYDSDSAGQEATLRALATVRNRGLSVRVIPIPDGKDPDDYIRKHGSEAFQSLVDSAPSLLSYQMSQALKADDYSNFQGKVNVLSKAVSSLAEAQENAQNIPEVNEHIRKLSEQLSIHESDIRNEIRKHIAVDKKDKNVNGGKTINMAGLAQQPKTAAVAAERHLIRLMFEDNSIIPYVQAEIGEEDIQGDERKKIIISMFAAYNMGKSLVPDVLVLTLSEEAGNELSNIMMLDIPISDLAREVDDYIRTIRLERLKARLQYHSLRAHELERMGDSNFLQELAESQRIKDEISKLHHN